MSLVPGRASSAFASQRAGNRDIYEKNVNGAGTETLLLATPIDEWPEDWSEDGRYLAYGRNTTQSHGGVFALPLFGDLKAHHHCGYAVRR